MINSSYYTLITEQKNDILINLKVIGKIGPGDKINTKKKHFDKDNTSWYQPFLRLYRGDSRECSINQVNCLINEANNLITVAIKSKQTFRLHPFGGTQDTENRRTPPRRGGGTFGYTPSGVHTAPTGRNLWFHTAASPPPTKPFGVLPIISIVKNYKSLFILLFVITFFIFGVVLTNQIPKINQKCAETAR